MVQGSKLEAEKKIVSIVTGNKKKQFNLAVPHP